VRHPQDGGIVEMLSTVIIPGARSLYSIGRNEATSASDKLSP